MIYRLLADILALAHLGFVIFVAVGCFLLLRWPRLIWIHAPMVIWGIAISILQWECPLTPLENWLRRAGGEAGFDGSFLDHYLMPVLYPPGLTPNKGLVIAFLLFVVNGLIYTHVFRSRNRRGSV